MKNRFKTLTVKHKSVFIILIIAAFFRFFGLNWDQGQHLHPDERFLTMVTNDISLPRSTSEYFSTNTSPLNPYNQPNYQFFVYGTFPIFFTKYIAVLTHLNDYGNITLLGRCLSGIFDLGIVFLLYSAGRIIWPKSKKYASFAALIYAFFVLPIQLSHFFAVDTFLNFFLFLSFYGLLRWYLFGRKLPLFVSAAAFGTALACKISAVYFSPVIALFFIFDLIRRSNGLKVKKLSVVFKNYCLLFTVYCSLVFIFFRTFQPYAFTGLVRLNPHFLANLKELQSYNRPDAWFPPGVQWLNRTPVLFPLQNLLLWGLGLPLGILFLISIFQTIKKTFKIFKLAINNKKFVSLFLNHQSSIIILIAFFWIIFLLAYQGTQYVKTMRYFLPIYPFIALLCTPLLVILLKKLKFKLLLFTVYCLLFTYPAAFLSIYSRPHSRVQASLWIYENIPPGAAIANEHWDDPLPLHLPGYNAALYEGPMLALFGQDEPGKWASLWPQINSRAYLLLSSNRLWGTMPRDTKRYPVTSRYYQNLFDGQLPFQKSVETNSYPGFSLPFLTACYYFGPTNFPYRLNKNRWFTRDPDCFYPGLYLRDDTAEEAFSVYDHPKVVIFKKV